MSTDHKSLFSCFFYAELINLRMLNTKNWTASIPVENKIKDRMHYHGRRWWQRSVHYFKYISGWLTAKRTTIQERYRKDKITSKAVNSASLMAIRYRGCKSHWWTSNCTTNLCIMEWLEELGDRISLYANLKPRSRQPLSSSLTRSLRLPPPMPNSSWSPSGPDLLMNWVNWFDGLNHTSRWFYRLVCFPQAANETCRSTMSITGVGIGGRCVIRQWMQEVVLGT
jgi:hypothetical protein